MKNKTEGGSLNDKIENNVETTFSTIPTITGENIETKQLNLDLGIGANIAEQVKNFISENLSKIKGVRKIALPGQAHASGAFLALGEMLWGLPKNALLVIPGSEPIEIDLSEWRHEVARNSRDKRIEGEKSGKIFILQGGHPIDPGQYDAIAKSMNVSADKIVAVPFGDNKISKEEIEGDGKNKVITALMDATNRAGITVGDWESGNIIYAPAGLGALATLHTTAIYGVSGQWPNMVRLALNSETKKFEYAETINLQSLRQEGKNIEVSNIVSIEKNKIKKLLDLTRAEFGDTPEFKEIESKI